MAPVLPARLVGAEPRKFTDRLVIVTDPDVGPVNVRWSLGRAQAWRCRECGPMSHTDCLHTFAAAVLLAEHLLGLTRSPELQGTPSRIGPTHV